MSRQHSSSVVHANERALLPGVEWLPDNASASCMRCNANFTVTLRRHHCRWCGKLFCSACAPAPPGDAKRRCKNCHVPRCFMPGYKRLGAKGEGPWQLDSTPMTTILSFLDVATGNALLQTCKVLRNNFPVPDLPWRDSVESRFPSLRGGWARVGKGASGTAHFCEDRQRGVFVAVKLIAKEEVWVYQTYRRLHNEIELQRACQHPNIARLYDVFQTPTDVALVVEAGEGRTLKNAFDVIRMHKPHVEPFAAFIIQQVVTGIEYLRQQGIAHRDIKAENIVLSRDFGRAMLIDFGLAERVGDPPPAQGGDPRDDADTRWYVPCGTPGFASPENVLSVVRNKGAKFQATRHSIVSSDNFSLAVIAFMMLSGTKPYRNTRSFPEMHRDNERGIRCEGPHWVGASRAARDLVERMLANRPERRPTPAEILSHELIRDIQERYAGIPEARREKLLLEDDREDQEYDVVTFDEVATAFGHGAMALPGLELTDDTSVEMA